MGCVATVPLSAPRAGHQVLVQTRLDRRFHAESHRDDIQPSSVSAWHLFLARFRERAWPR